jgi:hypothetical protein
MSTHIGIALSELPVSASEERESYRETEEDYDENDISPE